MYAIGSGTLGTMGVMRFPEECDIKVDGYSTIATYNAASKSMVCRIGASRAAKHIQLSDRTCNMWLLKVLCDWGKVDTKESLADLHMQYLPVDQLRYLSELHQLCMSAPHYKFQTILVQSHHDKLAA